MPTRHPAGFMSSHQLHAVAAASITAVIIVVMLGAPLYYHNIARTVSHAKLVRDYGG